MSNHFKPVNSDKIKAADICISVQIACHSSVRSIDHLSSVIKAHGEGSVLGALKLHRTKTAMIIKNVVTPTLQAELKKALAGKKFSLLIDESTDVSSRKILAICVRFYNDDVEDIIEEYLGSAEVLSTSGESLFTAVAGVLYNFNLDIKE